jgi:pimeloyl-ACP methyl ester carboxylesterase
MLRRPPGWCRIGPVDTDHVTLGDGRRVAVHRLADGTGEQTVVPRHAAPGAGSFDPEPEQTGERGVTLLGVDRPGYGGSAPVTGDRWASVALAADDLAEVLDRRGSGPVGVAGWSAGGRVALALAARRPDLVERVAVVATPAPDEAVPWIPPENKAMLDQLRGQPPAVVHQQLTEVFAAVVPTDPAAPEALDLLGAGPPDEAALARPGARARLAGMLEAAFCQGATGLAADIAGYTLQPWGFDPGVVEAATLLLYGAEDAGVGPQHGRWWHEELPDARLEVVPGAGHLLVIPMWHRVLSHLVPEGSR